MDVEENPAMSILSDFDRWVFNPSAGSAFCLSQYPEMIRHLLNEILRLREGMQHYDSRHALFGNLSLQAYLSHCNHGLEYFWCDYIRRHEDDL